MAFLCVLLIQYFLLCLWVPLTQKISNDILFYLAVNLITGLTVREAIHSPEIVFADYLKFFQSLYLSSFYPTNMLRVFSQYVEFGNLTAVDYMSRIFQFSGAYLISIMRFMAASIFVASFLLRPLVMKPLLLIWARIVESEKPVFTLIGGGISSLAVAAKELAKHL
jgi:hypothetical protein